MKIEILYVATCPNHRLATERVNQVLAREDARAPIEEVEVRDQAMAESLGFPGSPTIRIDGRDIEPQGSSGAPGLACRLYRDSEAGLSGVPSLEAIRRAVRAHRDARES